MKKEIKIVKKILSANDKVADEVRKFLKEKGIFMVNIMGSPGAGKTSLIEQTIKLFPDKGIGVIEGDIQTTIDAERLSKYGVETYEINTGPFGGDCHLEASWISSALQEMNIEHLDLIFIENIGNLVCPAEFDTGAHLNVVILSLPEGEDKPQKYPLMFRTSQCLILSKIDLNPYLDVDIEQTKENANKINPKIKIFPVSAKSGEGIQDWVGYIKHISEKKK